MLAYNKFTASKHTQALICIALNNFDIADDSVLECMNH